jgi:hypothetical protein
MERSFAPDAGKGVRLEHFLGGISDLEQAQYKILAALQETHREFSRNIIYPYLSDLIHLFEQLQHILRGLEGIRNAAPGEVRQVDLEACRVIYERPAFEADRIAVIEELIRWALPYIQEAIEEGRTIFEFVEEHLHMEPVGIVPTYQEEGYLIIPDQRGHLLHVLQYQLSVVRGGSERYRTLRTVHLKQLPLGGVYPAPQRIKLDLIAERRELPNPATYFFATDLDFPFAQTVLPVAKRKLMRYLFTQIGNA